MPTSLACLAKKLSERCTSWPTQLLIAPEIPTANRDILALRITGRQKKRTA